MAGSDSLLLAALASGQSMKDAAVDAGMSLSTAQRRRREPDFVTKLNEICDANLDDELRRVNGMRDAALDRLHRLMQDEDPNIALRAIALTLNHTMKLEAMKRLGDRIAVLEAAADEEDLEVLAPPERPDLDEPPPPPLGDSTYRTAPGQDRMHPEPDREHPPAGVGNGATEVGEADSQRHRSVAKGAQP